MCRSQQPDFQFQNLINFISFSGIWTKYDFKKYPNVAVSLETSYLHLKTSSGVDSGHKLEVRFFDEDQEFVSGITISFVSVTGKFQLDNKCMKKSRPFDMSIPVEDNRLWSIKKRGYRIIVSCNGLIVLDVTASSETCNDKKWNSVTWGRKVVGMKLERSKNNNEKLFYYIGKWLLFIELLQF